MGKLIQMPALSVARSEVQEGAPPEERVVSGIDFSPWIDAPRERTPNYFPVYSAASKAMQTALRAWVREWVAQNPEIYQHPHQAYAILVYQSTHPFSGRPTNTFTYDIQQTAELNQAFRSAVCRLGPQLKKVQIKTMPWFTRRHYFAYRRKEIVSYVRQNPRLIYRMLHVETRLVDALLRFTILDIPELGMEKALARLRRTFFVQLRRFSVEFDFTPRVEELLSVATKALAEKMADLGTDELLAA